MDAASIISIIKATSGTIDSIIQQVAWFFAIKAAANWLSFTLPLLVLYGVLSRVASTLASDGASAEKRGLYRLTAWVLFCISLYTGVRGVAPVLQAAVAPSIYIAAEVGEIGEMVKQMRGQTK